MAGISVLGRRSTGMSIVERATDGEERSQNGVAAVADGLAVPLV